MSTFGAGWGKAKETPELKPPESCSFCGGIPVDFYWVGFDQYRIYAETCNQIKCHKWLKEKVRIRLNS